MTTSTNSPFLLSRARDEARVREDEDIIAFQPTLNVGAIGHVAHGKSTIVEALTGIKTAKSSTELKKSTPRRSCLAFVIS